MKAFEYVAATSDGDLVNGTAWAASEAELDGDLEAKGLVLTRAKLIADERKKRRIRIKRDELISFTNQLSTVTGAGLPIVEGLDGIGRRMSSSSSRQLVSEMTAALTAGESLSKVMESYPRTFPPVYQSSVRAGEASGSLDTILGRLAKHLEWMRSIRATTIQALIYPAILCCAITGLIAILLYFVIPRLVTMFPGGAEDLPAETRFVMAISNFLTKNVILIVIGLVAGFFLFTNALKRPQWRRALDGAILRIPRLGNVAAQIATTKFAGTASILHGSGCDMFTVLDVASSTCGNEAMAESLRQVSSQVRRGAPLSEALSKQPRMDPLLIQMVSVGEKTGRLDECLQRLVDHYDDEIPRSVKRFLSLLEPALLLGAGGVVAFILLAALMPIFDLYQSMG